MHLLVDICHEYIKLGNERLSFLHSKGVTVSSDLYGAFNDHQTEGDFKIPVFSYQVSGEYSMIVNSIKNKSLNENVVYESLISLKRAGSNAIVTYFALDIAKKINKY